MQRRKGNPNRNGRARDSTEVAMRHQNPPQAQLNRANEIERYTKPLMLIGIYATAAILYFALIAVLFLVLAYSRILEVSPTAVTVFTMVAVVPASMIAFAPFLRPRDPVSRLVSSAVDDLRKPIELSADSRTFRTQLMDGDTLCVNLAFHYPVSDHTEAVRERLHSYVRSTLTLDFATRRTPPNAEEIKRILDHPMESLAAERGIEILYAEVRGTSIQNSEGEPTYFETTTGN